ncbi:uncharacterized protein BDZ99DRAFT_468976 [Mytilinidion resinicola]|uniref:Uncharacterized protein n=1 Tax=Mytilinidion resinicola TaxID=574789 RepID=A0A6A6Y3D9_9PEZI|nr:uncharacterized protein BDZ99DRAFT_468976 [Mytilinidion resinicola]KAF2802534.1 hypothetical protein BDZ99DRAFT_468976 [Mytilinidion resinicola]
MSPPEHRRSGRVDRTQFTASEQGRLNGYASAQDLRDFAIYQHGYGIGYSDGVSNMQAGSWYDRDIEDFGYGLSSAFGYLEPDFEQTTFQIRGQEFDVYSYRRKPHGNGIEHVDHFVDLREVDSSKLGGIPFIVGL